MRRLVFAFMVALLCGCAMRPAAKPSPNPLQQIRQQIHKGQAGSLSAGAAKVEITPKVGTPLAGYLKRHGKPSTGIRDPLYVRTLALSDGQDKLLLISADLLVFPQPMAERLLKRITKEHSIPRQSIVLAATHTHSGSGGIATGLLHEQVFGRYDPDLEEGIASRTLWSVRQALERLKPVQWGHSREGEILRGFVENRADPQGPVDAGLSVLVFSEPKEGMRAIVVNASAHPTLLDSQDMRLSADYTGEVCRRLETDYPGSICLFLNGAAGNERPSDSIGGNGEERVERFGGLLAEAASALAGRAELRTAGDLAAWGGWFDLPEPQIHFGPVPIHPQIGRRMRPSSVYLNLAALDGLLLVPFPAEPTTEIAAAFTQKLATVGKQALLFGYANGYLGYAVTPKQYESKTYEATMTWYGPDFGQVLENHLLLLAGMLEGKE